MDHATIEERGLVERYYRGTLPPEEEARFEEHFVACRRCQEELEAAHGLERGMRALAAEEAAGAVLRRGLLAWLARRGPLVQAAAAVLLIALGAAVPSLLLVDRSRQLAREAAAAEQRTVAWQERVTEVEASADALTERLVTLEEHLAAQRRRLRELTATAGDAAATLARPLAGAPLYLLSASRGTGETPTIELPGPGGVFSLALDAGADPRFAAYRVTIRDAAGETVFERPGLVPNRLEVILLTFPGDHLPPGPYRLRLTGTTPEGETSELATYPFRIVTGS